VHSVERALSASTLLPTVAFAALGAVTVLLVAQMGISPLGAVGGPSARDGGRGVTMPRMSISIGPQRLQHSPPARDRETTTTDARTGPTSPTGPTTLILARPVAHANPPTSVRESPAPDAQSAAMTAAATGVAVTNAAFIDAAVTTWEVTTAAVGPQAQADMGVMVASEVMYTVLARPAMAPTTEPEDHKSQKSLKSQNEDTSVTSVKTTHTTQSTDATQAPEHAKAAKSGP